MKKVVIILALVLTSTLTFAQEPPVVAATEEPTSKFALGIDLVYPYMWRGIKLNHNELAFQPYASYAFTDKLTFGVWATTNLSNSAKAYNEFDWYVSYQATPVTSVMLSDYYYNATIKSGGLRNSYFKYDANSPHVMDLSILFDFSENDVPLEIQWNTIIVGNDFDANGKRAFSSYAEIGYTYTFENAGVDLKPFIGVAVINKEGFYGYHKSGKAGTAFTNVGLNLSKEIAFSENTKLPVFIRYTYNENGNVNNNGDLKKGLISGGMTFTIK